ncbi:MAG: sugar phosphate isomerase/epimerase [bacterium]|nr:sugar phosphate isomerase/epimerase [bacterium]
MQNTTIAAQLYTIRDYTRTPRDIAVSLQKVRDIGYRAVQLSGLGPIEPSELKRITDDLGLAICATHIAYERMEKDLDKVIEEHSLYQCPCIGIGGLPGKYRNAEGYAQFAEEASKIAAVLAEAGFTFVYHNHSFELERFGDRTGLAVLYEDSDPAVFMAEIDTYWIQHGGGDPSAWISGLSGRIPVVHLKDMAVREGKPVMAEVGEGNLNWKSILSACSDAGVIWYIVEQDNDFKVDPFESLRVSYNNLLRMGLE